MSVKTLKKPATRSSRQTGTLKKREMAVKRTDNQTEKWTINYQVIELLVKNWPVSRITELMELLSRYLKEKELRRKARRRANLKR